MRDVSSRYKLFGGFGLMLLLNTATFILVYMLLFTSKVSIEKVDFVNDPGARYVYAIVTGIWLLFLILLITQSPFIIANREKITFINPVLPFLRRTYSWSEFDYYILIEEHSRYDTYEAVWLVKNDKLKARFSSFYYSNYEELQDQVTTLSRPGKYINPINQLLMLLRLQKIKL